MNAVGTALYARLVGGTALTALLGDGTAGVYHNRAPEGSTYPLVVFNLQSGLDDNKSPHRARQVLYQVKGVSATNMVNAGNIDAAADALLHLSTLAVASPWQNYWLVREQDVQFEELAPDGQRYYHQGGIYRARIAQ